MILASLDIPATANTLVYRVASDKIVRRIILANRTGAAIAVRLWAVPANTPRADDHAILYDTDIQPQRSVLINESEIKLGDHEEVWAYAGAANVSITVMD